MFLKRKMISYCIQFSSVTQSCLTLCNPMNCNTPGLPVHHQLPEFTQTHVHRVSDAIQTSHPLMPSSPSVLSLSQHQVLFQWVSISDQDTAASTLVLVCCSISPSNEYWGLISLKTGLISFLSKGLSGVISSTTVSNSLAPCLLYGPALTTVRDHMEDHSLENADLCQQSNVSALKHTV